MVDINPEIKDFFSILSDEFPSWLYDYINTKEMQRIDKISISCGLDFAGSYDIEYFYSNLHHSIGVALIIWNFTKDKKQTLAGLFHDISCPVFKHCIDFLNKDHENQESTEHFTEEIIANSIEIRKLLKRDNIALEDVIDYKKYPIADNETPKLSADRLEYTFSSGLTFIKKWDLKTIKECYQNLTILKNEEGIDEIGFKSIDICEKYISIASSLWPEWVSLKDKTSMQFIADVVKYMIDYNYLSLDELYELSELDVVNRILNCEDKIVSNAFKLFQKEKEIFSSEIPINDKYCVSVKSKTRYVVPLVQTDNGPRRINEVSDKAKKDIETYLNFTTPTYGYFNFDFNPNKKTHSLKLSNQRNGS